MALPSIKNKIFLKIIQSPFHISHVALQEP